MNDYRKGIDRVAIEQDVQLDEIGRGVSGEIVVQRPVSPGDRFELVEKVENDLRERNVVGHLHSFPGAAQVFQILLHPAPVLAELEHGAQVLVGHVDVAGEDGLLDSLDRLDGGQFGRIVDHHLFALDGEDPVHHGGGGGDQGQIVFALQPLLHDFHVQKSEVSAAKPKAQRGGNLRFIGECRIIEAKLLQGVPQAFVLRRIDREDPGKDHWLDLFEPRKRGRRRARLLGHRVPDLGVLDVLDVGDQDADLTGDQLRHWNGIGAEHPQVLDLEALLVGPQPDPLLDRERALEHPDQHHHPAIAVVPAVEDQRLQGGGGIAGGRVDVLHHRFEDLVDAHALLRRGKHCPRSVDADHIFNLGTRPLRIRGRQVDLVDHRDDVEVVVEGHVDVGEGLRLHPLRRIHHQKRPLAGSQRTGDLISEVNVSRGIDQIEHVIAAVARGVVHPHGLGFDGDPPLPFEFHVVEKLRLRIAGGDGPRALEQPVGKGRLPMIDVGDDGEVSEVGILCGHVRAPARLKRV